ncbi:ATP-binding cassette, subfamily B, MsbA [Anaerobranca californiensis DSM 14826]|jgi:subfamily B ATP-binding cassette protein MsbA|uniref:ATP-binding cassette, subfamily B, MsbA n=1 Tax=Anaerobranca californiensis DSM 14826 TaxID=1120989 RepID=A0A1M6NTU4_9FIRM|nr:ATP-binding cassette, subfamily B, MsbA [Anaerobranca californiensis DSM 14826]
MENKTAIVIAHRLSTIKNADRILVMDGGTIVEEGSHEELLEKEGIYAKMFKIQFGEAS